MWKIIHTEFRGDYGYSVAIVFYFACIVVIYLLAQYVIVPIVKSF